jgi:tellurite resistance-related uncharacterized protein
MIRTIAGYHVDDRGEWVAELSCLHAQHVRHQPPFQVREWVTSRAGRQSHVGTAIDCPLCDRAELPDGLHLVRTAGPFDASTVPSGLLREHRIAQGTWGRLRVLDGALEFSLETEPPTERRLDAGDEQAIPPGAPHRLGLIGPVQLAIDFLVRDPRQPAGFAPRFVRPLFF